MEHKRDFEIIEQPGGAAVVVKDTYIRGYGAPDEREKVYTFVHHVTTRRDAQMLLAWLQAGKPGECPVRWTYGWEGPGWYAGRAEGPGWGTFHYERVRPMGRGIGETARQRGLGTPRFLRTIAELINWVGK